MLTLSVMIMCVIGMNSTPALASSAHAAAPLDQHPAAVYLAALAPTGRRAMHNALNQAAATITAGSVADALAADWRQLRFAHVAAVAQAMREAGKAPATVNQALAALKGVARSAWRLGLIDGETLARIVDVKGAKVRRLPAGRHVAAGEVAALFRAASADSAASARDAAMLSLLYGTGLRRSEAVSVQVADYDQARGALRITGKGGHERFVYATNGGKAALDAWLQVRGNQPGALLAPVGKGGRVEQRAMTAQAVMMRLRTLAVRAGVQPFSPHDLRRSFVGELLDRGADVSSVQQLAGHASVTTTQRYDRRPDAARRRTAELLHVPYQVPSAYL